MDTTAIKVTEEKKIRDMIEFNIEFSFNITL